MAWQQNKNIFEKARHLYRKSAGENKSNIEQSAAS